MAAGRRPFGPQNVGGRETAPYWGLKSLQTVSGGVPVSFAANHSRVCCLSRVGCPHFFRNRVRLPPKLFYLLAKWRDMRKERSHLALSLIKELYFCVKEWFQLIKSPLLFSFIRDNDKPVRPTLMEIRNRWNDKWLFINQNHNLPYENSGCERRGGTEPSAFPATSQKRCQMGAYPPSGENPAPRETYPGVVSSNLGGLPSRLQKSAADSHPRCSLSCTHKSGFQNPALWCPPLFSQPSGQPVHGGNASKSYTNRQFSLPKSALRVGGKNFARSVTDRRNRKPFDRSRQRDCCGL